MKNYQKYTEKDCVITDGGTQWLSENDVANWSKDTALVEVGSEPADWQNMNIVDGKLVRASDEVIAQRTAAKQAAADAAQIAELKAYLSSTDWAVVKCAELAIPLAELYPQVAAARTSARARINEIEAL